MVTLLVDANLAGQAELLRMRLETVDWAEYRTYLDIRFLRLEDVGLDRTTKDDVIWRLCQRAGYYLLTDNRNAKTEDSLEATIRRESTLESLPVFTLADAQRVYHSKEYLDKVLEKLVVHLLSGDACRGTGRLYLP